MGTLGGAFLRGGLRSVEYGDLVGGAVLSGEDPAVERLGTDSVEDRGIARPTVGVLGGGSAGAGVVRSRDKHGLTSGGGEQLQKRLLVRRLVKELIIHGQSRQTVVLLHEGQQPAKLGKESLSVNIGHLAAITTITAIINTNVFAVKKNAGRECKKYADAAVDKGRRA